jgi:2-polyprenyl-3-methyl-5-hydroxy-6-metoxy-1,4-benzoquinol methylase
MDFVSQQYWDESYQETEFSRPETDDFLRLSLLKFIPSVQQGRAIEIGCYPGRYLSVLGDLGYELNGVDLTPKTKQLHAHLAEAGYKVGSITQTDFITFAPTEKYEVVTSFGFIEHFEKYQEVILKQVDLVAEGGYLVISTPNFKGFFQQIFHRLFDTPNFRRHNLKSMNPQEWAAMLKDLRFEIVFSGYGGGALFWMNKDQSRTQHFLGRCFLFAYKWINRIFGLRNTSWNHSSLACDCLLVAKKS